MAASGRTINHTWKRDGLLERVDYGNGMSRAYGYDNADRLKTITNTFGSGSSEEFNYSYDANSNRSSETRKLNGLYLVAGFRRIFAEMAIQKAKRRTRWYHVYLGGFVGHKSLGRLIKLTNQNTLPLAVMAKRWAKLGRLTPSSIRTAREHARPRPRDDRSPILKQTCSHYD